MNYKEAFKLRNDFPNLWGIKVGSIIEYETFNDKVIQTDVLYCGRKYWKDRYSQRKRTFYNLYQMINDGIYNLKIITL